MKFLIILGFLLISASAHAAVIHDTDESSNGWSFNYANTAAVREKVLFNIFVQKCPKRGEAIDCSKNQREARMQANKLAKEQEKKLKEKKKVKNRDE